MMIGETVNPRAGLFIPTMKVQPPAPQQLAPQLVTEVEVPSLSGPSEFPDIVHSIVEIHLRFSRLYNVELLLHLLSCLHICRIEPENMIQNIYIFPVH